MLETLIHELIERRSIEATDEHSIEYLWSAFNKLGLPVKIDGRALVLQKVDSLFNKEFIDSHLRSIQDINPYTVEILPVVDSTNEYLKQAAIKRKLPLICLAEYQTKGHGRRGNHWVSTYGKDICTSVAWPVPLGYTVTGVESLIIALALAKTLQRIGLSGVEVKWPNDVYVNGKKIAGILIEQIYKNGRAILIVGVGLNLMKYTKEYDQGNYAATSIGNEIGCHDRNFVTAMLIGELLKTLRELTPYLNEELMIRWRENDYLHGKEIAIEQDGTVRGRYLGIDKHGRLLLAVGDDLIKIVSGHITEIL